jgi:D-serine deaminase-like pyridoxal phosphate-dependent protein
MKETLDNWYEVENIEEVPSPSVLIYPDRIERNIRKMIEIAGSPANLRPHVKTHKMPEVVRLQMKHGISKFKCATIAEAEMVAWCGAPDILLAMQPVGPNLERFFRLRKEYKNSKISCIADDEKVIEKISSMAVSENMETELWLDLNVGMNRTGIVPGEKARELFFLIKKSPMLVTGGLHVYDGHLHQPDYSLRKKLCDEAFQSVTEFVETLGNENTHNLKIVVGGSPTFPIHAERGGVELSPGTILLWDYGYGKSFTEMDFVHAVVLLTRIVSKPADGLLCLDLGHKAVASEMPHPRIHIIGLKDFEVTGHNEEHMVIKTPDADKFSTGDHLYCIPWHICPTMDRHDFATVITNKRATGTWNIEARKRKITF